MYILILTYKKPLTEVERYLPEHVDYLDRNYAAGRFIASGRRIPRTGGVILCRVSQRDAVEALIREDPFYSHEIADYEVIEFAPTKFAEGAEIYFI